MIFQLLHGRKNPDQEMDGSGFVGPDLHGVASIHGIYRGRLRLRFEDEEAADIAALQLDLRDTAGPAERMDTETIDLLYHEDMLMAYTAADGLSYYGDWGMNADPVAIPRSVLRDDIMCFIRRMAFTVKDEEVTDSLGQPTGESEYDMDPDGVGLPDGFRVHNRDNDDIRDLLHEFIDEARTYADVTESLDVVAVGELAAALMDSMSKAETESLYATRKDHDGMTGMWTFAAQVAIAAEIAMGDMWREEARNFIDDMMQLSSFMAAYAIRMHGAHDIILETQKEANMLVLAFTKAHPTETQDD